MPSAAAGARKLIDEALAALGARVEHLVFDLGDQQHHQLRVSVKQTGRR